MNPEIKLKIQNIFFIIGIGLIFGLIYNFLFYPHTFIEFLEAGSISVLIGFVLGILEEFAFKNTFQKLPSLLVALIRTLLYSLMISIILCLVLSVETSMINQITYTNAVLEYLKSPLFQRDFLFSFSFIFLILFILHIIQLIGRANFFRLIFGFYHKPREVLRIFMFLDLKGSTTIAEKLSNKKYSSFIRDFFDDVSNAIILFRGEIYQYVGDEIIIVWPVRKGNLNCILSFFKIIEIIGNKRNYYLSKYNIIPEFKAGIHAGQVIVTEVGQQKKEIVYHGDVLNTTSRIQEKCNELDEKMLVSEELLHYVQLGNNFTLERIGAIEIRGKSSKLEVFSILSKN